MLFRSYGNGPCKQEILMGIARHKLETKVNMKGKVSRAELLSRLTSYDIFILLSTNETLGLCYLEAISKTLITVGSEGEGISDYITHGVNGFLIDPLNKIEATKILEKIQNLSRYDLQKLRRNTFDLGTSLNLENMSKRYMDIMFNHQMVDFIG